MDAALPVTYEDGTVTSYQSEDHPVPSGRQRYSIISDGLPSQLPDIDPDETREWLESFDSVVRTRGRTPARYVLLPLLEPARDHPGCVPNPRSTAPLHPV